MRGLINWIIDALLGKRPAPILPWEPGGKWQGADERDIAMDFKREQKRALQSPITNSPATSRITNKQRDIK